MTTKHRAFSLVELLTVIAIIAVLAAILIPVVRHVRVTAHSASCLANLRQLAMAGIAYGNENGGYLPGYHWDQPGSGYPYGKRGGLADHLGLIRAVGGYDTVMTCPAAQAEWPVNYRYYAFNRTYAINGYMRSFASDETVLYTDPVRFGEISDPSKTMFFIDSPHQIHNGDKGWFHDHCLPTQKWDSRLIEAKNLLRNETSYIHGGSINLAYVDGHVESLPQDEMLLLMERDVFWKGKP
ncbi:MAG: prepilin-type N-terminal cleavage/methylation domain-containing protein [Verrucomicrobiota bacterium JB024]|nr:prepilin-type N-terminal cleavage/methylation domain-containing protein [Verrucomicrobiota bacterium JB024]